MKKCYKCEKERSIEVDKCECGETLVENKPNARGLYRALRMLTVGVSKKK